MATKENKIDPIASSTVFKKYKNKTIYNPKIIIPSSSKIESVVLDEKFDKENDAIQAALKAIKAGKY